MFVIPDVFESSEPELQTSDSARTGGSREGIGASDRLMQSLRG